MIANGREIYFGVSDDGCATLLKHSILSLFRPMLFCVFSKYFHNKIPNIQLTMSSVDVLLVTVFLLIWVIYSAVCYKCSATKPLKKKSKNKRKKKKKEEKEVAVVICLICNVSQFLLYSLSTMAEFWSPVQWKSSELRVGERWTQPALAQYC